MDLWKEALAYPPHTSIVHPCRPRCTKRSRNRCCSRYRYFLEPNLGPASLPGLVQIQNRTNVHARLARANLSSTPAKDARYLAFSFSWDTAPVPLGLTPLILTTARRQFVPRNRRDEPANHARAPHSDKVSTAGRRDFLVPAQPKPAGAAYQRVHRTLPPRAKPEYIGNPSPSVSDPAAPVHPALPCPALPDTGTTHYLCSTCSALPLCLLLLFSACLALSFPGHFIRDGGGNQQPPIVPSEPNTNIISFFLRRCPTLATRSSHPSFLCLARAPSSHSFIAAPSLL